jgi:alpha-ketoglutarate-dependent taurine dioxygenase
MILTDIHDQWCTRVELSDPMNFFNQPRGFWRELLYKRKLLVIKKMTFSKEDYAKFSLAFGNPWANDDYIYSHEAKEDVITDVGKLTLSPFSNKVSHRIKLQSMPYHADIPNRPNNPFPFRSLWITKNPNPTQSGITGFLNINEECFPYLNKELTDLLSRVTVIQQSWYSPGTDIQEHSLVKIHPITGERSLRLNYYNKGENKGAWICGVKIDGVLQKDCSLIEHYTKHLLQFQELQYFHTWDTFDILIYDNYPFIHNRSPLILEAGDERHFYRMNIDHTTEEEFSNIASNR